jgi:signal peptidase II
VTQAPDEDQARTAPRRVGLLLSVAALVLVSDVVTKILAVAHLDPAEPANSPRLLGGLIYLSLVRNAGAAFGMATGMTAILAVGAIVVAGAIIRLAPRLRSRPWAVGLGLVLGGALGNLMDRLFRSPGFLRGQVIDFISVFGPGGKHFPVFNLADSALTVGAITLALTVSSGGGLDGRKQAGKH